MDMTPVAGAGKNRHIWKVGSYKLGGLQRFIDIVDCQHESPRFAGLGCFKNRKAACIAEITLISELVDELDLIGIGIERREGNAFCGQSTGDNLGHAPEACNDDVTVVRGEVVECGFLPAKASADKIIQAEKDRRRYHR